ncbi:MAG: sugar ABC transporter ATP-binding protein [Clostridia bacterium]|nr:sugar ABC transporter ATP-binding protein [Clostridia bacterium]
MEQAPRSALLEMKHITKIFPGVKALDGVDFDLRPGEIHAIAGENGAGKSTFIKVLTGVHQPDGGEIILDGKRLVMSNPNVAIQHGIAAIYQHPASYPDLSVAENIFIGHEFKTGPFVSWVKARRAAQKLLDSIGANFSPNASVGALSVAQQQMVEIAKALSQNARILIMDEPTAALSKKESEELYGIARTLRDKGVAIILISHRFEDIFGLADRVTVFRDAHYIGTWNIDEVSENDLVHYMVGHQIEHYYPQRVCNAGEEVLRVENLTRTGFFRDVSFTLRAGEIVGLTGLVGAGRTEVVEAICGVTRYDSGRVIVGGKPQRFVDPRDAMAGGIGLLPEDRQKQGLLLPWSINHNITLPIIDRISKKGLFLSAKAERAVSEREKSQLAIKAPDVETAAGTLSGGNQQKVVIAKQLAASSRIIILDEPTKGVDISSKAAIYELMAELAAQGVAILMISSEMPEVMNMSDRIYVMGEGHITKEFTDVANLTQQQILEAAMPQERTA